ncbi:uncharacterized protein LOC116339397 [Contarinia nasturtii]|uniref:uncharacterized protein LOC116339397 n=1 Tax=Contarinia nasturtii TaxID=265458 RepID=UPI0012D3E00E|nr:uncharacterized protein LOC116339397 [Contarinia nasturtii]
MYQTFAKLTRQGICRQATCLQHFTRSYCYKPIERKIFTAKELSPNGEDEREWRKVTFTERYLLSSNETNGTESLQIVQTLPSDPKDFTKDSLIETFDRLGAYTIGDDALIHGNYDVLIDATKLILPKLNRTQCVHIFMNLCRANVPMFDELCEIVVCNLSERVDSSISHIYYLNEENYESFTLDEIIAIDVTIREYYYKKLKLSVLFDTLRKWIRKIFTFKMEHNVKNFSFTELTKAMRYLSSNTTLVESFDTKPLFQQLLAANDNEFQLADVNCILVTMSRFKKLDEYARQVVDKMFNICCNKATKFNDAFTILHSFYDHKPTFMDFPPTFVSTKFINCCMQLMLQSDHYEDSLRLLKCFNYLGIVNVELIDYISHMFNTKKHENMFTEIDYVCLVETCNRANYTPSNWKSKIVPAIERSSINPKLTGPSEFAVALKKLGINHKEYSKYSELFKDIERKHRSSGKCIPSSEIALDLRSFIGANKILYDVTVADDLTVQILMKANTKTGDFLDMNKGTPKENLFCNENEMILAVLVGEIASKSKISLYEQKKILEEKGYGALVIEESVYKTFAKKYKQAYVLFELIVGIISKMENGRRKK